MVDTVRSQFDYDIDTIYLNEDMSNNLFCTFATEETLNNVLAQSRNVIILYTIKFLFFIQKVKMSIYVRIMLILEM